MPPLLAQLFVHSMLELLELERTTRRRHSLLFLDAGPRAATLARGLGLELGQLTAEEPLMRALVPEDPSDPPRNPETGAQLGAHERLVGYALGERLECAAADLSDFAAWSSQVAGN